MVDGAGIATSSTSVLQVGIASNAMIGNIQNAVAGGSSLSGNTGGLSSDYKAPEIKNNDKGELTNGKFTLDSSGMTKHLDGTAEKSQFLYNVDANKAVLDAAAYADEFNLWKPSSGNIADFADKAKIYVQNGPVGVTGDGKLTNYINVYRTKTGYVHGCPGNP